MQPRGGGLADPPTPPLGYGQTSLQAEVRRRGRCANCRVEAASVGAAGGVGGHPSGGGVFPQMLSLSIPLYPLQKKNQRHFVLLPPTFSYPPLLPKMVLVFPHFPSLQHERCVVQSVPYGIHWRCAKLCHKPKSFSWVVCHSSKPCCVCPVVVTALRPLLHFFLFGFLTLS